MIVQRWKPCAELLPFVESYGVREAAFGKEQIYIPLPARRDCFLEFYLQGRYRIVTVATGAEHWAPRCVLVGPSTQRREDLVLSGSLQVFSIRFSPVGFRALFGVPTRLLRDLVVEAELALGKEISLLEAMLAEAEEHQWRAIAETFLLARMRDRGMSSDGGVAARATRTMQRSRGAVGIADAAARQAISVRQLERTFQEHVGVSPKVFARLLRLEHALEVAGRQIECNWAEIAYACGYFDQSHMVRDFRTMTGATPVEFARLRAIGAQTKKHSPPRT